MPDIQSQDEQPIEKRATLILVTRDRAAEIEAALDAIERSVNRAELAVIVMDNGSIDGTGAISDKFGETITYLKLPKNFGWVKAVNIAVRSAKTELIFILDPAVQLAPDATAKLIAILDENNDASAAVPALTTESGDAVALARDLPSPGNLNPPMRQLAAGETTLLFPPFKAFMLRKTFLKGMNFLDERFGDTWADAEICFQIRNAGKKIMVVSEATAVLGPGLPPLEHEEFVEADFMQGAAIYIGKHWGMMNSIGYRASSILGALFSFKLGLFFNLINGQKIDGTHA